jgi:hypothetical protein
MPKEDDAGKLASKIDDAITDATSGTPNTVADEKDTEKLDAQAELFVRKISDSVTKSIAELLKPSSPSPVGEDEEEVEEEGKKVRRKRRATPTPAPKKRSFLTFLG